MGRRFLRGLLPLLLPPPTLRVRHRMHRLEGVQPSKRPRCSLMAPPRIGTHNGTFHCDEALACALLRLLPEYQVGAPGVVARLSWVPLGLPDSPGNLALTPYPRDSWQSLTPVHPTGRRDCADPGPRETGFLRRRGRCGWRVRPSETPI